MFWGLIMEPNKRYTQTVEKPFHISQAALDSTTGDNTEPCQVMVVVDGKNFLVCTLQKTKCLQVPLDLYFKAGDAISFLTNGKSNVHLTGYLDPEFEDELEDEESDDEEAPALVEPSKKRKIENAADQKSKKAKVDKKQVKAADDDEESDDDEDDLEQMLAGDSDDEEASDEEEDEEDDDEEEDEEQNGVEESESDEAETTQDTTQDTSKEDLDLSKVDMSKLTKNQKKRLKKKLLQQQKPQVNGVDKPKKQEPQQKGDKPEKKGDKQTETPADKKEKKSLSGGVQIEDFKVGTGPVAKAGKIVHVYYEGRLKQNNKMFDSCNKGNGFKFRLGSKEVIAGWDIGVAGMKVGGKRKIICPPAMGYGVKGSPPVIPPNSTLVFEVELKNVK